jgi:hypothetical protein
VASIFAEAECEFRAVLDCLAGVRLEPGGKRPLIDDRETPVVEPYPFRQELGAEPMSIAGDGVEAE